jgi:hypothetical protein
VSPFVRSAPDTSAPEGTALWVVRREQAQSAALAPVVEEAQAEVQQAATVNLDETGWRQERQRAWLWTLVSAELTVFRIDRRRSGAVGEGLLGAGFAGLVGSDRWSAYNRGLRDFFPRMLPRTVHGALTRGYRAGNRVPLR